MQLVATSPHSVPGPLERREKNSKAKIGEGFVSIDHDEPKIFFRSPTDGKDEFNGDLHGDQGHFFDVLKRGAVRSLKGKAC